jgi:arylformamidase
MIFDVTVPITHSMPVWPGDPAVEVTSISKESRDNTHTIRVTNINMGSHTGTHIDAPFHMMSDGKRLEEIPLEVLTGNAIVLEIFGARSIGPAELAPFDLNGVERVLLKTDNSKHWNDGKFYEDFVYLEPESAEILVKHGVRLVGIDYLSIDKFRSPSHPSHFVLLKKNIPIIEGLNLNAVSAGRYTLVALPLNLQNADGAPTRVILVS